MDDNRFLFAFAGEIDVDVPQLTEEYQKGKKYVNYGSDNFYPEFLNGLYRDVTSLKTIIDGTADYVAGDDVKCNIPGFEFQVNKKGMKSRELITLLARDYLIYGGYSFQVIRSKTGKVVELYYLDFRYCRTDSDNEVIYYNPEFSKKYGRTSNMVLYPRFITNGNAESSVVYVKNTVSSTYPIPRYSGAIKSCLIERRIDDLHLNGLANGFMSSYLINFNNGTPTDEQKKEIEKAFKDKFSGTENAGKIILSFNNGKDNMATVQKLDAVDFSEKYDKAAERSREQIYASFRANPQLFGIVSQATGFSAIEYKEAYQLYYITVVKPIQRLICDYFDRVFNTQDSFTITPFNIDNETNNENVN